MDLSVMTNGDVHQFESRLWLVPQRGNGCH